MHCHLKDTGVYQPAHMASRAFVHAHTSPESAGLPQILHVRSTRARSVSGLADNPRNEAHSPRVDRPESAPGFEKEMVMSQTFDSASMNRQHSFVNQLIRLHSERTAVVLTYLPPPPSDPSEHSQYLTDIRVLSGTSPTLCVYGTVHIYIYIAVIVCYYLPLVCELSAFCKSVPADAVPYSDARPFTGTLHILRPQRGSRRPL